MARYILLPLLLVACPLFVLPVLAQSATAQTQASQGIELPRVMPGTIERFEVDDATLHRFYDLPMDATGRDRLYTFYTQQLEALEALDYEAMCVADRIDWHLMRTEIRSRRHSLRFEAEREAELAEVLPFAQAIISLENARRQRQPLDPEDAAATVETIGESARALLDRVTQAPAGGVENVEDLDENAVAVTPVLALRAANQIDALRRTLRHWQSYYVAYDPQAAWWIAQPWADADAALDGLSTKLREQIAGIMGEDDDPLIGNPIGKAELEAQLAFEWITYSPEELIERAQAELLWCEAQLALAADEMGHGDNWRAALEHVKQAVPAPGEQDDIVAAIAEEAVVFLDEHDLVTIPPLCRETWRVEMLSRQRQRVLPFAAYGGQHVLVAAPTDDMSHEAKRMAQRGNNLHFTRNVTPHELIPGHHLQGYIASRQATHRRGFRTPFLVEGWALHWEFTFYDLGWPRGPEDRIGMLFWRAHRAARIVVSLRFHLGQMTPQEMIDYLVDRVGHERDSATSEVRRFIGDAYGPLYQCSYLVGGKQLSALRNQLVVHGDWSERRFHDTVLRQNAIPIHLIRAALLNESLPRDATPDWHFWD